MFPEDEWIRFIRGQFPHYVAFQTKKNEPFERMVVFDKDSYLYELWKHLNTHNCWARVYSEENIKNNTYDCLPFDFDGHEYPLEMAHKEAISFISYLKEVYNCEPRLYFSGRGFHIYIDFKPLEIKHFKQSTHELYSSARQIIQSDTMDFSIVGDWNRVMRLPYTMNMSVRQYCVPIDPAWKMKIIKEKAAKPDYSKAQVFNQCNHIRNIILAYEHDVENKPREERPHLEIKGKYKERLKMEIDRIYKFAPKTEDHRHRILHFMLVPRLIMMGCTNDEVRAECKNYISSTWGGKSYSDYSSYVEQSIKRTRSMHYFPWKFETFLANFPDSARWFRDK